MKHFRKQKCKKYIAGILTIALAAGVCQSYGSMEAMAKEATLPGIEKLVTDTMNAGEVFHILEIVPDKKNASIGYLIGGEEPVTEGRKLSELVSAKERQNAMAEMKAAIDAGTGVLKGLSGKDGAFTFSDYEEKENGSGSVELRGHFVFRGEGGHYNYVGEDAQYGMLTDGEDYHGTRYDRYSSFSEVGDTAQVKKYVIPTFSMISGNSSKQLQTTITEKGADSSAYAIGKYALSYYDKIPDGRMDSIDTSGFKAADYVDKELWQRQGNRDDYSYSYLGRIVLGASLPKDCTKIGSSTQNTTVANAGESADTTEDTVAVATVTGGDAATVEDDNTEAADPEALMQSASGNDPAGIAVLAEEDDTAQPVSVVAGMDENLYILDKNANTATLWAEKIGETYTFTPAADAYFLQFEMNEAGEYYVSRAVVGANGDWSLTDNYSANETGLYKMTQEGSTQVTIAGDAGFDSSQAYDFIGNPKEDSIGTVRYNGGFDNREWFKTNVLNLSEEDAARLQISVTTLTPGELADLVMNGTDYGITLSDIDMIYLSGQGDYAGAQPDATAAVPAENAAWQMANAVARLAFGIQNDTDTAQNRNNTVRVPVVMDYKFYDSNNKAHNTTMVRLAKTLLLVSNAEVYDALVKEGLSYWNAGTSTISETSCTDKVNTLIQDYAKAQGIEGTTAEGFNLENVKCFVADNVYLNNDEKTNYVSSDYLTNIIAESNKDNKDNTWVYNAVLQEIKYENFLLKKDDSSQTELLKEEVTKASVTRYILNWYMHRVTVKSSIRVLDLEPCYDFSDKLKSELQNDVVNMMGMTGIYDASAINITQMSSAEFIGKIEDLNEKYDMIYLGARVGKMNTENGVTVYNDPQMKGLIYSHVGDYYDYATKTDTENVTQARETYNARHRLQDSSLDHNKTNDDDSTNKSADVYRGPGNDMNSTRYEEFCQFIEAGYPVVIADTFIKLGDDKIPVASTATLDKNSYFYKLVQFALTKDKNGQYLYWQKNIFTESQLTNNTADTQLGTTLSARRSVFCNYLNLSKLSVNWVTTYGAAYPQELKYNSNQNGASNGGSLEKIDGKYQLQYIFNLQNDAAISQTGTTYDCKLFVDKNADGRFSGSDYVEGKTYTSSEEVSGLTVYIRKGDEWNKVEPIATANGNRYELRTGETYRVIRALPEEYVGVIPWKLVFYDNADRLVRTAKSGYTSVPQQSGKKTIRVLQLLSSENNNWNLHYEQNNSNSTFSKYINGLTDWNVVGLDQVNGDGTVTPSTSIDSMSVTDLVKNKLKIGGTSDTDIQRIYQESYNLFQKYDMLILGFGDAYKFGYTYGAYDPSKEIPAGIMANVKRNLAVGWAVRDYIESGKSILFTHDTTSYVNNIQSVIPYNDNGTAEIYHSNYWYWGYEFNKTIRASVGLDRYGALKEYYQQRVENSTGEEQKRDQEYLKTLESYTFDEIKEPNSDNELWQKEGVTKYTVVRFLRSYLEDLRINGSSSVKFPVENSLLKKAGYDNGNGPAWNYPSNLLMGDYAGSSLIATQVNEGQITQYPYQISADEQLEISNTHYQWLQPNMELDRNGDGKNDIVVWYCISGVADGNYKNTNIYNITPNDVVNNYYIYTMGNVTYSGAGHSTPSKESEIKLFVNTMIAAYNAGVTAPSVSFKDKSGSKIQSVYMLYDPVNHIVLDDKNNGTISVNFQADDYNILAGGQQLCVEFYKSCADDISGAISVDGITGKVLRLKTDGEDGLKITDSNGNVISPIERNGVKNCYPITNGATYTLKYSSDEMGLFSTDTSGTILNEGAQASTIYARVYTVYDNGSKVTPCGIAELSISAEELFELD